MTGTFEQEVGFMKAKLVALVVHEHQKHASVACVSGFAFANISRLHFVLFHDQKTKLRCRGFTNE
jgi:hypothetical protein